MVLSHGFLLGVSSSHTCVDIDMDGIPAIEEAKRMNLRSKRKLYSLFFKGKTYFVYYQLVMVYGILPIAFDILLGKSAFR